MSPSNCNDDIFEDYGHIYDSYSKERIEELFDNILYFVATSKQSDAPVNLPTVYDFLFLLKKHFKHRIKKE
ncbi:MAG: hypothetical protein JJT94_02520 [Bernardetiaceae bacterium]|nr:hypothetical protein [Bernardetiaceae bacterium]